MEGMKSRQLIAAGHQVVGITRSQRIAQRLRAGQQFWLGPHRAGQPVTLWIDTTTVHLASPASI
jgi:hypothetical protein